MEGIFFAVFTVLAWGSWLAPSQGIQFKNQQIKTLYVTFANLLLAFFVGLFRGFESLTFSSFWFPFLGGLLWSVSGYCAFLGTSRIGMAKAVGIWAPLNILFSLLWGIFLFGEFLQATLLSLLLAVGSVIAIITGILFIIFAKGKDSKQKEIPNGKKENRLKYTTTGTIGALLAGVLWGSYFIPIRISEISLWVAAFPMAVGMASGSLLLVILAGKQIFLEKPSHYVRVTLTGILWGVGNYASLRMMEILGTGKGFTIAQINVAFHALIGIFIFKEVKPKSLAAVKTIFGIALALGGAILLGNLK